MIRYRLPENTKEVEERARIRINRALADLGWIADGADRNILFGNEVSHCFPEIGKLAPDYVLMQSGSSCKPLAVVEAKKPNKKLDKAVEQARAYAKKIRAPLVFASDGSVVVAEWTDGGFLFKDAERLEDFVDETDARKLVETGTIESSKRAVFDRADLIGKFDAASKILRGEGINPSLDSVYEFCSVIFIKLLSEDKRIPDNHHWKQLTKFTGDTLVNQFRGTIKFLSTHYNSVLKEPKISKPETLESLVKIIDDVDFSETNIDIKGEAYEYFLSKYSVAQKSPLGQFFTPRHIVKFMVKLTDPSEAETIYDPYCGTGGMLVQSYVHLYKTIDKNNADSVKRLKKECLFGRDIGDEISKIAKMNMVLVGDGHSNIQRMDSNKNVVDRKYDIVITNIPFNLPKVSSQTAALYDLLDRDANSVCLRHCIKALKPRGRGAIIVPETIALAKQYVSVRKFLLNNVNVEAVFRLPPHTFRKYTSARTCILLVGNAHVDSTKRIPQVEIENDGFSDGTWREPIEKNDLPSILNNIEDFESCYPLHTPNKENLYSLARGLQSNDIVDGIKLGDLVTIKTKKTLLNPTEEYKTPSLSSVSHSISPYGSPRLGKNIKDGGKGKVMIEPGDLVIGTLHTQRNRGLFAISTDYYVATSQLVVRIKDEVNKNYLCFMLETLLPKLKMKGSDLVGRETYSIEELLDLRIPYPPSEEVQKLLDEIDALQLRVGELAKTIDPSLRALLRVSLENAKV